MSAQSTISFTIRPGKKLALDAPADIRLGQAVLDSELADQKRSSLRFTFVSAARESHDHDSDDEEHEHDEEEEAEKTITLANLIPGVIEAQSLGGLIVSSGEKIIIEVTGKNTVHISGNIILQDNISNDDDDDFFSEEDSEQEEDELDDEELKGMTEADRNEFLKALSRDSGPEPTSTPKAEVKTPKAEVKTPKKEKKDKKGNVESATPVATKVETETEKTPVKEAGKKRKEIEESPKDVAKTPKKAKGQDGKAVPVAVESAKKEKKEEKKEKEDKTKSAKKTDTKILPGGLKVTDKVVGEGPGAKPRQFLQMRYILKLANGKIVDKNTNGRPFKFKLGAGEVIKGWDEGLVGMKVGGERLLEVPAAMGYGKKNTGGIPANSTLFFEVKLLDVK